MKAKITVEIEGEENIVANLINDLTMLVKHCDEPICHREQGEEDIQPHFKIVGDALILDRDFIDAWERSTYIDLNTALQILESTKLGQMDLLPNNKQRMRSDGSLVLPKYILDIFQNPEIF